MPVKKKIINFKNLLLNFQTKNKNKHIVGYWTSKIIISVFLLYIVYYISLRLSKTIKTYLKKKMNDTHKKLNINQFTDVMFYIFFGFGILSILLFLDVPGATILTLMGTSMVAVGLALQSTLSNIFSGVVNAVSDNFRIGDHIRIIFPFRTADPIEGEVVDINFLYVKIIERSTKKFLYIPNSTISGNMILNMTRNI